MTHAMNHPMPILPPIAAPDSPVMLAFTAAREAWRLENRAHQELEELQRQPTPAPIGNVVAARTKLTDAENLTAALWQHYYETLGPQRAEGVPTEPHTNP